jgi:hypothetical protein
MLYWLQTDIFARQMPIQLQFFSCAVVSGSNMEKLFIIAKPKANGDAILASWWLPEAKQERGISDD